MKKKKNRQTRLFPKLRFLNSSLFWVLLLAMGITGLAAGVVLGVNNLW